MKSIIIEELFIAIMVLVAITVLVIKANNIPVVFKTTDKVVCGCAGPKDYMPSLEVCKHMDISKAEVIYVKNCN